jgi:protein-tyrosine-phosphatase
VHFICRGNGLRSIMAEAYLKSLRRPDLEVISSGTVAEDFIRQGMPVSRHALQLMEEKGLREFAKDYREQLTQERVKPGDMTICMNQIVADEAAKIVKLPADTIVWQVMDLHEGERIPHSEADEISFIKQMFSEITHNIDTL